MKTLLAACVLLFLSSNASGQRADLPEKTYQKLNAAGLFFQEDFGSIAFLPRLGDERYKYKVRTHWVLPESGYYKIPKKGNYFFKVNHAATEVEASYLGVVAYIIYPPMGRNRDPLNLTRNKANWEAGHGRKLGARRGPRRPEVTLEDFFEAHRQERIKSADELLHFTWHAAVEKGGAHSFDSKKKWLESDPRRKAQFASFLQELSLTSQSHEAAITAHILHFVALPHPKEPLVFWFNGDGARGAYLRVFSPIDPAFDKEFFLKFP